MSDTLSEKATSEQMEAEDQRITARQKKSNRRGHNGQANSGLSAQAKKEQNYELIKKGGVLVIPPCSRCDTPARRDKGVQCIMAVGLSSRCAECYKHNYVCDKKDWIPPPGQPRPVQIAAQALAQLAQRTPQAQVLESGINGGNVEAMRGAGAQSEGGLSPEDILSPRMGQMNLTPKRTPLPSGPPSRMGQLKVNQQRDPMPPGPPLGARGPSKLEPHNHAQAGARPFQNLISAPVPYNGPLPGGQPIFTPQGQVQYNTPTRQDLPQSMSNTPGAAFRAMAPPNRQMGASLSQAQQGSPFSNGYKGAMNVLASVFTPGGPSQQCPPPPNKGFPPVGTFTTPSQPVLQPVRPNQQSSNPLDGGMNLVPPDNGFQPAHPLAQGPPSQALPPQHSSSFFHLRRSASQQFNLLSYSAFPEQNNVVEINNPGQYPAFEVVVDGVRHYAAILTPVRGESPMIGQQQLPHNIPRQQMQGDQQLQSRQDGPKGPDGMKGQRGPQGPQVQDGQQGQQTQRGNRGNQRPQFIGDRQMQM